MQHIFRHIISLHLAAHLDIDHAAIATRAVWPDIVLRTRQIFAKIMASTWARR